METTSRKVPPAAGANDYIAKPFDPVELEARVRVGERMVKLQRSLAARVSELEEAVEHVHRLQGPLPISVAATARTCETSPTTGSESIPT